jgi:hypothetical protein
MAFLGLGMWWLLILVIVLVILSIRWDRRRCHRIQMYHQQIRETTVLGDFVSDQDQKWSRFSYQSEGVFIRHIQGTPTSQDEKWIQDPNEPNQYSISDYVYAELVEGDAIQIVDITFSPTIKVETLTRVPIECPVLQTPVPTLSTVNQLYDLVYLQPDEYAPMKDLIERKKGCAMINDWSMFQTTEQMEEGVFAVDKKKTCFFYVMPQLVYLYSASNNTPQPINVSELEPLFFAGAAIV